MGGLLWLDSVPRVLLRARGVGGVVVSVTVRCINADRPIQLPRLGEKIVPQVGAHVEAKLLPHRLLQPVLLARKVSSPDSRVLAVDDPVDDQLTVGERLFLPALVEWNEGLQQLPLFIRDCLKPAHLTLTVSVTFASDRTHETLPRYAYCMDEQDNTAAMGAVRGRQNHEPNELFNEEQLKAIRTPSRHVLVKAGAGTGKTTTIVGRCAYQIESGIDPSAILALTFTRKAAAEVQNRVEEKLGARAHGLRSLTFHSWCMSLLRGNESAWGYKGWTVIDADDQETLFRACRGKRSVTFPSARALVSTYSFARNMGVGLARAANDKWNMPVRQVKDEILPIVRRYEQLKQENRYLDYDDILVVVGQQLARSEKLARWVAARYPNLLVDEMQDTNPIQWDILLPLVPFISLYCVGDDAQSIYGFRGASFDNIHHFQEVVPGAEVIGLALNYRSTQEILDLSNWLLAKSPLDYDKHLVSNTGSGYLPEVHDFANEGQSAMWICDQIAALHDDGEELKSNLILSRTAWGVRAVEGALLRREIPYVFFGGQKLLESAHIRDVLSALRVVANPLDTLGWMRLLTLFRGIGDVKATELMTYQVEVAKEQGSSDYAALPEQVRRVVQAVSDARGDVRAAVRVAFRGLQSSLEHRYRNRGWDRRKIDFPTLEDLAAGHSSILGFIEQYLIDPLEVTALCGKPSEDAVTVATIHSAKGMEADNVFIVNAGPGNFPSPRSLEEGTEEEERRVLYVALTRARHRLFLTRNARSSFVVSASEADDLYFLAETPERLWRRCSHVSTVGSVDGSPVPMPQLSPIDLSVQL